MRHFSELMLLIGLACPKFSYKTWHLTEQREVPLLTISLSTFLLLGDKSPGVPAGPLPPAYGCPGCFRVRAYLAIEK